MNREINNCRVELLKGDITDQHVDAIVNAANEKLAGGGGVDGAIHAAAGPNLKRETDMRYPRGCPTGSAVASHAHDLPADFVFHAVGPIWNDGKSREDELLASAFHRCLELAVEHECESLAFPAISTGVYCFPLDLAAEIAIRTTLEFLDARGEPKLVRFVLFGEGALHAFERALDDMTAAGPT